MKQHVDKLASLKKDFKSTKIKTDLLQQIIAYKAADFDNVDLILLHDTLLFIRAYPDTQDIYDLAKQAMKALCAYTIDLDKISSQKKFEQLVHSGIAHTKAEAHYNLDIIKVMIQKYVFFVEFDSFGADLNDVFSVLSLVAPEAEAVPFSDEMIDVEQWLNVAFSDNPREKLHQIVQLIEQGVDNDRIKTDLFSRLQVFVKVHFNEQFSRSLLHFGHDENVFCVDNKGILKNIDLNEELNKPVPMPTILKKEDAANVVDIAQVQLFSLLRELDAITYADPNYVEYFEFERGFSVALMYQKKHKRSAIDSLIGCISFKNGVPYSYTAFWILGHTAKVAFNIFEVFRGGESTYFIAQLLRLLKHYFHIHHLSLEPYQIGKNNDEGLQSGAFWFYYKMGFKSADDKTQKLADSEYQKIKQNKTYKTPIKTLEKLVQYPLVLNITKSIHPFLNATDISLLITQHTRALGIHSSKLENAATKDYLDLLNVRILSSIATLTETESFKKMSVVFSIITEAVKEWSEDEKNKLFELMTMKLSGNERDYILKFQNHQNLLLALYDALNKLPKS